ncbi:hypothetical protein CDAR_581141 [Caerostris darwini]|uniref:C2H2-type domain-containing protein n=1 Tax=Caerostris darwini TaxID=1538125 RepID=A0AAV4WIY2_9ARAC|nr:hypothetical protein CDAR_581141 [Caerostris darwini]
MATSTIFPTTEFSKCFVCSSIFPNLQQLIDHCRQQHTDKPFVCDLCGRAIKYLRNFKHHQMVHSGEKPHECQECERIPFIVESAAYHIKAKNNSRSIS